MQRTLMRDAKTSKKKHCATQRKCQGPLVTDETLIRAELKKAGEIRGKASQIATAMGVSPSTVTRWNDGGEIPPPMILLLNLYFFGIIPFEIVNEKPLALQHILDFTEDQFRVITILATRQSTTPAKWIADKIRWILAGDAEARAATQGLEADRRRDNLKSLPQLDSAKVADDSK
jgi:transcriptional regulator with XRE-family HTH domain